MVMTKQDQREWHLDRKVTVSLIAALLANAGATIWWASALDQRVVHIETQQMSVQNSTERIARAETQIQNIDDFLKRIDRKLDRLIEDRKTD